MDGYIGKKPDTSWWLEEISKGIEARKKHAYEAKWKEWDSMYRGDWAPDQVPVNLFFQMLRTTVPRTYFRNPGVSILPAQPGLEYMVFAKILERIDNKMLRISRTKGQVKRAIQHAFKRGTGILKTGFSSQYNPAVARDSISDGRNKTGFRTEYSHVAQSGMPWMMSVHPKNIVFPAGLDSYEDSRFIAERIVRPINDIREDPRLKNTKGLVGVTEDEYSGNGANRRTNVGIMWEVRDLKTGRVMVLATKKDPRVRNDDPVLLDEQDLLQTNGRLNYHPIIFNLDEERIWGTPDSKILEPYQKELNENRRLMVYHRRLSIVRILVQKGKVSREEALKLISQDVLPLIWINGPPRDAAQVLSGNNIPDDLLKADEVVRRDIREGVGFSRNAAGEFNPGSSDTTATEAQIVREAMEIRVDERRDIVADALLEGIEDWHQIIFEMWTQEDVIDLVGPGGVQVWVKFSGDLLKKGRYTINIDPDSSLPQTRAMREQKAVQVYGILKENPLIDPSQLTQYLLHEMHGVQFDDMMRALPMQGVPQGPITPQQFGGMIGKGIRAVA